uniref:Cysteine-rich protein 1 n=1 Tax=Erpetoichthys calabaricus TaxID=27687 RepID=A0A8C4RV31_ERPCA
MICHNVLQHLRQRGKAEVWKCFQDKRKFWLQLRCVIYKGNGFGLTKCQRAERVNSLGKDWHRPCLKCEKCKRTLTPGSHSEHEGKPYCTKPCHASLFGAKGPGNEGLNNRR